MTAAHAVSTRIETGCVRLRGRGCSMDITEHGIGGRPEGLHYNWGPPKGGHYVLPCQLNLRRLAGDSDGGSEGCRRVCQPFEDVVGLLAGRRFRETARLEKQIVRVLVVRVRLP